MADENNIGASRLLGTNGLQQAVDSLTNQVNRISRDFSKLSDGISNAIGSTGRSAGGTQSGNSWNSSSNRRNYSSNGGGGSYTGFGGSGRGAGGNGGGGVFTGIANRFGMTPNGGSRFAGAVGAGAGIAAALTAYGNNNMSTNMQMDMFNNFAVRSGGFGPGGYGQAFNAANRAVFQNNYLGLGATDIASASYLNTFTSGMSPQINGGINSNFMRFQSQVQGFGYNSPTQGALGAAQAAQQTYSGRGFYMSQALGLPATIGPGGVQTPMGDIARAIMNRSLTPGRQYTPQNISSALSQTGGLGVSLQYISNQMGWSQGTQQEYRNYITNLVQARSKGMSDSTFDQLLSQAQGGSKKAQEQLKNVGIGNTMFETQRNLNSTRLTRQSDILESLSPAFQDATDAVNKFSEALTSFLKNTGLDKAIGTGAGWGSAVSGGLSGFGSAFGAAGGVMTAARLFGMGGGGSGGLGGLFRGMGGGGFGGGTGGAGGIINATRGANGVFDITSLGNAAGGGSLLARGGPWGLAALGIAATGTAGWKSAVSGEGPSWLSKVGDFLRSGGAGPLGSAAGVAGNARRTWDMITGKNNESIWSLLFNPAGKEKRSMPVDGRPGGGSGVAIPGGSGGNNGSQNNSGASAAEILKFAQSQLGVPYVWGGESPGKGMDCSGLVQWAFGQSGVSLPRTSQEQAHSGSPIAVNGVQPGDLLFKGDPATHVAIAMGNGKIIEAPHTGANVRIRSYNASEFTSARRVVGSVGDPNSLLNNNTGDAKNSNTLNNQQNRSGGNLGSYSGTSESAAIASALASSIASLPMNSGSRSSSGTSGTSTLGTDNSPNGGSGGNDKASLQAYAKQLLAKYGWADQWNSFDALVNSESSWDIHATNASSGAYGLPQALPANKLASAGADWKTNGQTQLRWMMDYINGRYHSPNAAWSFHQRNNWYSAGAWNIEQDQNATVHKGEMIVPAKQAETIRQVLLNNSFNPGLQNRGSSGGINIGTIQVNLPQGYMGTKDDAYKTGRMIMDALTELERTKNLQIGQ